MRSAIVGAMVLSALCVSSLTAQELRGSIIQPDGATPASGVIVVLLAGSRDSVVARVVTGERGTFVVKAPKPMRVRLQLLRMGSRPTLVGPYELTAGSSEEVNVTLTANPIVLSSFDVKTAARCAVRPDTGLLVAQLYDEARKALMSSATAISGVTSVASIALYTRNENLKGQLTAPVQRTIITGPTARPFASLSADSLARIGYVTESSDGATYRAPDAEVLFSEVFLSQHCLQLVRGDDDHRQSVGIGFRAMKREGKIVDVRGTLWLDKESAELQSMEFEYDGIAREYTRNHVGGVIEFTHMQNGVWFINKWSIRMPHTSIQQASSYASNLSAGNVTTEVVFDGLQTIGGSVQSVKLNGEILYASNDLSFMSGDMAKLAVTAGRTTTAADAAPSASTAIVIDSLTSESSCGASIDAQHTGSTSGRVTDQAHHGVADAIVSAEWKEDFQLRSGSEFQWKYRSLTTTTSPDGTYGICGLPIRRPVTITATAGTTSSRAGTIRVDGKQPRASLDMALRTATVAPVSARGARIVVTDLSGQPIAHAVVSLNGTTQRVTDDDGAAIILSAPDSVLSVVIRRIGYTQFDGTVKRSSRDEPFLVKLGPTAQALKSVNVRADRNTGLERSGFYERVRDIQRGAVNGEFFTPEQIDARNATKFSMIFSTSRFVKPIVEGGFGQPSADGKHDISLYGGAGTDVYLTGRNGCMMALVVDGVRIRGEPKPNRYENGTEKVSADELVTLAGVRGIEVYPSVTAAPPGIASIVTSGADCGVILVWTSATR